MSDAARIAVLSPAELEQLVARAVDDAVRRVLAEASTPSDWIGPDETAELVGVSRDYLRRLRDLPRHGSPRRPRYKRSEVEQYIASGRRSTE